MFETFGLIVVSLALVAEGVEVRDPNHVVAIVGQTKILFGEIAESPGLEEGLYAVYLGKDPNKPDLEQATHTQRLRRLARRIRQIVINHKIQQLGIAVSDKEVDKKVGEVFQGLRTGQVQAMIGAAQAIRDALAAWQKDPGSSDAIYQRLLANIMSKEQWRTWQVCYSTPEKLEQLSRNVPRDVNDVMRQTRESVRRDLLYQRLVDAITKDVHITDTEVRQTYKARYGGSPDAPTFEAVAEGLRSSLVAEKKAKALEDWLRLQYKRAGIRILDTDFRAVMEILQ